MKKILAAVPAAIVTAPVYAQEGQFDSALTELENGSVDILNSVAAMLPTIVVAALGVLGIVYGFRWLKKAM